MWNMLLILFHLIRCNTLIDIEAVISCPTDNRLIVLQKSEIPTNYTMQGILEKSNSEFTIDCNNNGQCSNGGITGEVIPVSFNFGSGYSHSGNSIKTNGGVDYEEDYFTGVTQTQDVLDLIYVFLTRLKMTPMSF